MTRLTDAQEAAQELAVELDRTEAAPFLEPIRAALDRMAQLEEVAELARELREAHHSVTADEYQPGYQLDQAITELDAS